MKIKLRHVARTVGHAVWTGLRINGCVATMANCLSLYDSDAATELAADNMMASNPRSSPGVDRPAAFDSDPVSRALAADIPADPPAVQARITEHPSPFEVVGSLTYDPATDKLGPPNPPWGKPSQIMPLAVPMSHDDIRAVEQLGALSWHSMEHRVEHTYPFRSPDGHYGAVTVDGCGDREVIK